MKEEKEDDDKNNNIDSTYSLFNIILYVYTSLNKRARQATKCTTKVSKLTDRGKSQ